MNSVEIERISEEALKTSKIDPAKRENLQSPCRSSLTAFFTLSVLSNQIFSSDFDQMASIQNTKLPLSVSHQPCDHRFSCVRISGKNQMQRRSYVWKTMLLTGFRQGYLADDITHRPLHCLQPCHLPQLEIR